MASPGEYVKRGAPLLRIEASEFVQAQSDLLNAAATLKLARINEERKHAAFDSKGGSLQDWQQAQADLAAAENAVDVGDATACAFSARRTQEIAALEACEEDRIPRPTSWPRSRAS